MKTYEASELIHVAEFLQHARYAVDNKEADEILLRAIAKLPHRICHHFDRGWNDFDPLYCAHCQSWAVSSCREKDCAVCTMFRSVKLHSKSYPLQPPFAPKYS